MPSHQVNVGMAVFHDIDANPFLNELHHTLLCQYAMQVIASEWPDVATIDLEAALRFADLLSKSTHPTMRDQHRLRAQEIALLCHTLYPNHVYTQAYVPAIFTTLGNYPALKQLNLTASTDILNAAFGAYQKEYLAIPGHEDQHFFIPQKQIYDRLVDGKLSFSAPTSLGKSFIMRTFVREQIEAEKRQNFAIIVPSKALINETRSKLIADLTSKLERHNYRVVSAAGDIVLEGAHNFIFVLTPERLLYLLIDRPSLRFDYVFFDEAHKLTAKNSRAPFYYQTVTLLQRQSQSPKFIFSSPNIPNPEVFLRLISTQFEETHQRSVAIKYSPVTQFKFLLDRTTNTLSVYNDHTKGLTPLAQIQNMPDLPGMIDHFASTRAQTRPCQTLVYASSKQQAVDNALEYARTRRDLEDEDLQQLANDIARDIHHDYHLRHLIPKGVAYHIGYLPPAIRERIEEQFRAGKIRVLFCTSTLLEGVNLPADNLIITKNKIAQSRLTEVDFRNLVGRVGRIEYNLYGNVFILADDRQALNQAKSLLEDEIPQQHLSIETNSSLMSKNRKEGIVTALTEGVLDFPRISNETQEIYETKRKFGLILLRDIMENRESLVREEFADHLTEQHEASIRKAFTSRQDFQDDDINVSVDQVESLNEAIRNGLRYPSIRDGVFNYEDTLDFLTTLADVFNWRTYESDTLGKTFKDSNSLSLVRYYAVLLNQWMEGLGLSSIMNRALSYYEDNPDRFFIGRSPAKYHATLAHRNVVFADVLANIENILLFKLSNYFLKFSNEFKRVHGIQHFDNDWYEYVEYGTTNENTILLQRIGFSRESATYIRNNFSRPITQHEGQIYLTPDLLKCSNINVRREAQEIQYNVPGAFKMPNI